jgi:hypothetical protein
MLPNKQQVQSTTLHHTSNNWTRCEHFFSFNLFLFTCSDIYFTNKTLKKHVWQISVTLNSFF